VMRMMMKIIRKKNKKKIRKSRDEK
jgi:hypothetical protein